MKNISALIFAKYPQPGSVKTRMVPPLTAEQAATLHQACLRAVCERVSTVKDIETTLVVTPDDQLENFQPVLPDYAGDYWPQGAGDLGERLIRAVDRAFSQDVRAVILLGADSPTLPIEFLQQTIERLSNHDAVLGPCEDGGYYLIGMKQLHNLFEDITWSTSEVLKQTLDKCKQLNVGLLEEKFDIDTLEDLKRYQEVKQ